MRETRVYLKEAVVLVQEEGRLGEEKAKEMEKTKAKEDKEKKEGEDTSMRGGDEFPSVRDGVRSGRESGAMSSTGGMNANL